MDLEIAPFISHLVDLLREGNAAFRWNKAGNAIIIDEAKAPEVLQSHQRSGSFASFARQLNFYGFRRVKSAVKGIPAEYSHPLFRKGRSDLISQIRRKSSAEYSSKTETDLLRDDVNSYRGLTRELSGIVGDLSAALKRANAALAAAGLKAVSHDVPDVDNLTARYLRRTRERAHDAAASCSSAAPSSRSRGGPRGGPRSCTLRAKAEPLDASLMPAVGDDADALYEPEDDALYDGAPEPECGAESAPLGADADEAALDAAGHGSSAGQFGPPSASTGGPPSAAAGLLSAAAAAAAAPPPSLPLVDRAMLRRMVSAAAAIVGPPAPRAGALRAEDGGPHDPASSSSSDDAARVRALRPKRPRTHREGRGGSYLPLQPWASVPPRPLDVDASSAPVPVPVPLELQLPPDLFDDILMSDDLQHLAIGRGAGGASAGPARCAGAPGLPPELLSPGLALDHGPAPPSSDALLPPTFTGGGGPPSAGLLLHRMDSFDRLSAPPPPALGPPAEVPPPAPWTWMQPPLVQQPSLKALPPLHPARGPSCSEAPLPPAPPTGAPQAAPPSQLSGALICAFQRSALALPPAQLSALVLELVQGCGVPGAQGCGVPGGNAARGGGGSSGYNASLHSSGAPLLTTYASRCLFEQCVAPVPAALAAFHSACSVAAAEQRPPPRWQDVEEDLDDSGSTGNESDSGGGGGSGRAPPPVPTSKFLAARGPAVALACLLPLRQLQLLLESLFQQQQQQALAATATILAVAQGAASAASSSSAGPASRLLPSAQPRKHHDVVVH